MSTDLPASRGTAPQIQCVCCGHDNLGSRRFCKNCGNTLFFPCPHCQNAHAVDEKFCGDCGGDIAGWLAAQEDAVEAACQAAQTHRDLSDWDAALAVLSPLKRQIGGHPKLRPALEHAELLLNEIRQAKQNQSQNVECLLATAQEHEENRRYADALAALEKIPPSFRTESIAGRLLAVREKLTKIQDARREIQDALAAKQTRNLLPKVIDLLRLQPYDAQLERLAQQLAVQYTLGAKKMAAARRYRDAFQLLRQIPPPARNDEARKLLEQTREIGYLLDIVDTSPFVDETLVEVARRLQNVAAKNESLGERCQLLAKRRQQALQEAGFCPLWATSPQETLLNHAVNVVLTWPWLDDSQVRREPHYVKQPERYHIPIGLALQGLGKAAIHTNLVKKKTPKSWKDLGGLWRSRQSPRAVGAAWGIHWESPMFWAVKLSLDDDDAVHIEACYAIPAEDAPLSESAERASPPWHAAVEHLREEIANKEDRVCVSLHGIDVLSRLMTIPPSTPDKVEAAIRYESKHQIPFKLDEVIWDYHIIRDSAAEAEEQLPIPVRLTAVKEQRVAEVIGPFRDAGVEVDIVQSSCVALINLALHQTAEHENQSQDQVVVALLDIGHHSSNLVLAGKEVFWSRSWGVGTCDCIKALVRDYRLTGCEAEKLFARPWKATRMSRVGSVLSPIYEKTVREIRLSLNTFAREFPEARIARINVVGGFHAHGLMRYLRSGKCDFLDGLPTDS